MASPPSLLIWHPGALGDLVSLFPLINGLRRRFQPLAVLCQGSLGRLAAAERLVDVWLPIEAAWTATLFAGEPSPEARRILSEFSDFLVFSFSEALAACLQGLAGSHVYRLPPRPPAEQRLHVADYVKGHLVSWDLIAEGDGESKGDQENSSAPQRIAEPRVILLHPGAGSPRKRWPLEGFIEVAEHLQQAGDIPQFLIGPAEEDLLAPIAKTARKLHRPADSLELRTLLRSVAAYIGNDSGVSHLAAWTGLPSVVIFGPTDPVRWAPRGRRVQIVQPPLDCRPCFETADSNCASADCLGRIAPETVLDAWRRVVRGR
jgi:ADP-heptose:LPS heptosyltransferase